MTDKRVALLIRIPATLKSKLSDIAKREHRSLNQQIEFFLDLCAKGELETANDEESKIKRRKT